MRRDWQIMALLAAATLAVFWQVSWQEFINFDDPAYVTYNPVVRQGLTWPGVVWAFTNLHGEVTYWHPLTWLSHMLDCQLFGLRPAGHHLSNLFLHTLNTLLLFAVLRRMTGRRGPSALVAALFALHPLQVDSVAWVAERKNVLSAFFGLLCLWAYVRYAQRSVISNQSSVGSNQASATDHGPQTTDQEPRTTGHGSLITDHRSLFYLLSLLCFALGLMSKPTLVPLPFVLLLLDYWPLGRLQLKPQDSRLKTVFVEKLPFLALSAASSLMTIRALSALGGLMSTEELPMPLRLANVPVACALYLRKLAWPVDLSVFYLHPGRWPAGAVAGSTLFVLGVTALAVWQVRRRPYLIVGWLWFLGMLVPVIGLVQVHIQALADRFAYLPAIGVFVMVVWAAAEWITRFAAASPGNHRWPQMATDKRYSEPRSSTSTIPSPDSGPKQGQGRSEYGPRNLCSSVSICGSALPGYSLAALVLAGCVVMTSLQLRHWRNSITLLQHAVQVEPRNFIARIMLGNALFERRQFEDALRDYQAALLLRPNHPEAWLHAGVALTELGRPVEAMPLLTRATQMAPAWPEAQRRLALALLRQGRTNEARAAYQKLLPLLPDTAEGCRDLADMLAEGQQYAEAVHFFGEALRLKPGFEPALNNLAMLRSTCPQPGFRDGRQAVQLAEAACRSSARRNPSYLGTLAAAYAEAGRLDDAVKTIQEALALARASGADELVPVQTRMLQEFLAGKPFR